MEAVEELNRMSPEDTEFDHYTDEDAIQTYASPLTGNIENIVILLRFAGEQEYVTPQRMQNAKNTYNQGEYSLKEYMNRISYGSVNVNTTFYPQNADGTYFSVQLSKTADYFKMNRDGTIPEGYTNEGERRTREAELVVEAVEGVRKQLEASGLELDRNRDGCIDGISFITSSVNPNSEKISHGDLLWAHKTNLSSDINLSINGIRVNAYNLLDRGTDNTGVLGGLGAKSRTTRHEFLHTFTLPDLYHVKNPGTHPLGPWDIMAMGNTNITAYYQREYLGFGDRLPVYTSSQKGITLKTAQYKDPSETYAVILKPANHPYESFIVEKREIEFTDDAGKPAGEQKNAGLLVYRIYDKSPSAPNAAGGNSQGPPDFIYAFRPGESGANAGDGEIGYATLSPDNPKGFTSLGKPLGEETPDYDNKTIYYEDGSNSGIVIDNLVVNADNSITFDVTFPETIKGSGTKDNPYEIYNAQHLYSMSTSSSGTYYKLMNDIDMSNTPFTSIKEFKGILDGNNKTIKNISTTQKSEAGFIGTVWQGAVVKNLTFSNPTFTAADGYTGIFSEVFGTLDNIRVNGGTITSQTGKFSSRAGGLAGVLNYPGAIKNCYTSAAVNANEAGGLVAYLSGGSITNSYACGKVSGLGNNPVTGGTFAYYMNQGGGTAQNTFWDIQGTGQSANGLVWGTSTSASLTGCCGLKLDCPDSVTQGAAAAAKISSPGGSVPSGGTWKSSNTSVITVNSSTGAITGIKGGTAAVSYNFTLGTLPVSLGKTVTCQGTGGGDGNGGSEGSGGGDNTGGSVSGWYFSNGKWYYFGSNGAMVKGWIKVGTTWYYTDSSGVMLTGWVKVGSTWYYMNSSGAMLTGWVKSGASWYYMSSSGAMLTGWVKSGASWYYMSSSGAMLTGWVKVGGSWYYMNGSGVMLTGRQRIGGKYYTFRSDGSLI